MANFSAANPPDLTRSRPWWQEETGRNLLSLLRAAHSDLSLYDEFLFAMIRNSPAQGCSAGPRPWPTFVSLDNEPGFGIRPIWKCKGATRITSDNYITKKINLTKALKDQFPKLVIFGPCIRASWAFTTGSPNWLQRRPEQTGLTDKYHRR